QMGAPEDIYLRPANRFVATFIGEANLLPGERRAGMVTLGAGACFAADGPDGPVTAMVRPEAIRLGGEAAPGELRLMGQVEDAIFLGTHVKYEILLAGGERMRMHGPADGLRAVPGDSIALFWPLAAQRLIDGT